VVAQGIGYIQGSQITCRCSKWGITFRNGHAPRHRLYHELASVYDLFYSRIFDYDEFYSLIEPELEKRNASTILEVACGTGRLMRILEENGYTVTGLDLSGDMLAIARSRVKGDLVQQDMRRIKLDKTFDALICLGSGFTYMQRDDDVESALNSFHRHLNDDGVLIFDNFDAERFNHDRLGKWEEETHVFDGLTVTRRTRSSDWDFSNTWTVDWVWRIEDEDSVKEVHDSQRLKAFRYTYLQKKLVEAGFRETELLRGRRLLIKAEKGRG